MRHAVAPSCIPTRTATECSRGGVQARGAHASMAAAPVRSIDVAAIADVAHHPLVMVLDPIPTPELHPPPPGFTVRTFRPEDADADRQSWGEVEVSAGEFPEGTPEQRLRDATAKFTEEFMPYVSVRHRPLQMDSLAHRSPAQQRHYAS